MAPMSYGGFFLRFVLILAQRVGGMGRALLLIVLWVALCLGLVLAGALVGLSDHKGVSQALPPCSSP